jgi:hypothetical protein
VVLAWQVSNATTVALDGARAAPIESRTMTPLATTTYTLTAQGQMDAASAQVTVVVEAMATGLLPDRGGFVCAFGSRGGRSAEAWLLCLGLAVTGILLRHRRRPPR